MAKRYTVKGDESDSSFKQSLKQLTPKDRFSTNSIHTIEKKKKWLEISKFCGICWLLHQFCTCAEEKDYSAKIKNHIWLYLHYREYGRSTNTGMLINRLLTENSTLVCYGNLEQEEKMFETIKNSPNTFVLFPSKSAITFAELSNKTAIPNTENQQKETNNSENQIYNIIVLDATWKQAKQMIKRLPTGIPHIKLGTLRPTISKLRKQSSPDRITTAEATIALLEEMNDNPQELKKMWEMLEKRIDHVDRQSGGISKVKQNVNEWDLESEQPKKKRKTQTENNLEKEPEAQEINENPS